MVVVFLSSSALLPELELLLELLELLELSSEALLELDEELVPVLLLELELVPVPVVERLDVVRDVDDAVERFAAEAALLVPVEPAVLLVVPVVPAGRTVVLVLAGIAV